MSNTETLADVREIDNEPDNKFDLLKTIYASEDFRPTPLMCELLVAFVEDNSQRQPKEVLSEELGSGMNLWYMWRKRNPGFIKWWNSCLEAVYSGFGVPEVWSAVKRRALVNSPQDAKLFIERFDVKYKPITAQEHTFAGYTPDKNSKELAERSRARERKVIESKEIE